MKNILYILCILFFVSCGKGGSNDTLRNSSDTLEPEALVKVAEEDYGSFRSGKGYTNLVEEIYTELSSKNKSLESLNTNFANQQVASSKLESEFNDYHSKSQQYYEDAGSMANSISDSLIREQVIALLKKSELQDSIKCLRNVTLLSQLQTNSQKLEDLRVLLKISLTLPSIQKYQSNKLPSTKPLLELLSEQERVIIQTKKALPK
ncbi:MAG: hypothetical protein CFE21_17290 [Bacteroidetes bacterium B1(2017)]|nr:MAG: hypothetical protein CFE21_17290 [Bacteroidetes bacterium B1(2017)]